MKNAAASPYSRDERISSLLTVVAYDPETSLFFQDDQSLSFGFLCAPMSGSDGNDSNRLNTLLNNDWPAGTFVQFCLWTSPNLNHHIDAFGERRPARGQDRLLDAYVGSVQGFVRKGAYAPIIKGSDVLARDIQLLVVCKVPLGTELPTDDDIRRAGSLQSAMGRNLSTIGIPAQPIDRNRYLEIMGTLLNWSEQPSWTNYRTQADDHTPLKEQIADYDVGIIPGADGLQIGDAFVKTLSVKGFPRRTGFGVAGTFLGDMLTGSRGIREPVLMSATLFFPDTQSAKNRLDQKRYWTINQAYGPLLKFVPQLAVKKEGFDALHEAFQDGDRPVRIYLSMSLFCRNAKHAEAAVSNAKTYWIESNFKLVEDKYFYLPCFLNSLPFGPDRSAVADLHRFKTMATRHTIPLLPLFGDWKGTGTADIQLFSRNGQVMNMSLFDSDASFNAVVAAQSGSGKSFLTNEIISAYLSQGGQVWAIDVGGSYAKQVENYEGDMLEFTAGRAPCINPFPLVNDFSEEEDALIGLIIAMAAPRQQLTDLQTAELKRVMKHVWEEKGKQSTVDDVARECLRCDDQRVKDVGTQLYPFTSEGEYGKYMVGDNNVTFQNRFTVLELEALKGRRHLQQVVLLELVYQIQQTVYLGKRDRPKLVIIDEAWDLLSEGNVAAFINDAYRRFRKYGASAIVIMQSVSDLYENEVGRAIAENSPNMFLLGQKDEAIDTLKSNERLSLSEGGYRLLKSVHTVKGVYSEIFCITDRGAGIARLVVDDFRKLMYSTDPRDVQAIADKQEKGMTIVQAIEAIQQERARG